MREFPNGVSSIDNPGRMCKMRAFYDLKPGDEPWKHAPAAAVGPTLNAASP